MTTTITPAQRHDIREALTSPDLTLVRGIGDATTPGQGGACTIAEIHLVLTGELTDGPHPCISEVIRNWTITIQDRMPADIRNSTAWREAAVGIAGSVVDADVEQQRMDMILGWMWERLGDPAVLAAIPQSTRPAWDRMLAERTVDAALDARKAAQEAVAAAGGTGQNGPAHTVGAAWDAADAACLARDPYRISQAISEATGAVGHAAWIAAAAGRDGYWQRADPAGLLTRLIATT